MHFVGSNYFPLQFVFPGETVWKLCVSQVAEWERGAPKNTGNEF